MSRQKRTGRTNLMLAPAAVLLTGGALTVAGVGTPAGHTVMAGVREAGVVQRDLVCPGGPQAQTVVGQLPGAPGRPRVSPLNLDHAGTLAVAAGGISTVPKTGTQPDLIRAGGPAALGALGSRISTDGRLAAVCTAPASRWWFTGAGASPFHSTTLELTNPRPGVAIVDVTVLGPNGQVAGPALRGISIASGTAQEIQLANQAPSNGSLQVKVHASRGLVTASAYDAVSTAASAPGQATRTWLPPATAPSMRQLLTGLPAVVHQGTLTLANPGAQVVLATVRLVGPSGTFTPVGTQEIRVPATGATTVDLTKAFAGSAAHGSAVLVTAAQPISAGLSVSTPDGELAAITGRPLAGPSGAVLPAGTHGSVLLSAGSRAVRVTVASYDAGGRPLGQKVVDVGASSTSRFTLPTRTALVVVTPQGAAEVSAAVLLQLPHGVSALPLTAAADRTKAPEVRPAG